MWEGALSLPWVLLGGIALCAVMLAAWQEARLAGRVIAQFFLTIALPVLVGAGILIWLGRALLEGVDARIGQALIAGLVIAVGWLTTAIFAELGRARGRAEKLRDYHKAIYAEIGNTLQSLWEPNESDAYVAKLIQRMKADDSYVPFIPREVHDNVYDAVVGEIDVLPRQTIDAVVAYYSLIKSLAALSEDMRGETFRDLETERRVAMYTDYVGMRKQAYLFGKYALKLIRAYSDGGPKAAQKVINTQGAGRSATLQGSA